MGDNENLLQIPLDGDLAAAIARRAQAAGRGDDLAGFVHDVVAAALLPRGWFYGFTFLMVEDTEQPDWHWRSHAHDADDVRVVDGALVFTDATGRTTLAIAPGRWKEVSIRLDIDRELFGYKPPTKEVEDSFKAAAAAQQGWPFSQR